MEKYNLSMRILHWVGALLIISVMSVGLWMTNLPNDYPGKFDTIYPMHKSFGILVLFFIVLRIINRWLSTIPKLPEQIKTRDKIFASISMFLLYVCMLVQPISGYLMSSLGGHNVDFFTFTLPNLFAENKPLSKVFWYTHIYNAYALIALITIHLIGTFKHYFVDKINILPRIW